MEVDNNQLRALSKLILLQLHKLPKNSVSAIGIWSKLGRWKSLISGCLVSWLKIKKKKKLKCLLLFYNNKPFLNQIIRCNEKWILCDSQWWRAQWLDLEAPEHFPKSHLHQKRVTATVVVCRPADPLQLSESWGNHTIWEVCSANRWEARKAATFAAGIGQQNGPNSSPDHTFHNQRFNWMNWATKFHLICHFTWHIANWLLLLQASWKLSAGKILSQPSGGRKCFPRVHQILKHGFFLFFFFCLISSWQKWVDCDGYCFD